MCSHLECVVADANWELFRLFLVAARAVQAEEYFSKSLPLAILNLRWLGSCERQLVLLEWFRQNRIAEAKDKLSLRMTFQRRFRKCKFRNREALAE